MKTWQATKGFELEVFSKSFEHVLLQANKTVKELETEEIRKNVKHFLRELDGESYAYVELLTADGQALQCGYLWRYKQEATK